MDLVTRIKQTSPTFVRSAAKALVRGGLRLTSPSRTLPDFLIVGAQKAGTSSLLHYLNQHPQVLTSTVKEPHYFDSNHHRGEGWYRSFFPLTSRREGDTRVGEATPYYLVHPHAPARIHALLPEVKLIALLRNPVERAISHYYHEIRLNTESLPLMEALQAEEERTGKEWKRMVEDETYRSSTHQSFSYKQRGVYADQLERYLQHFDRSQMLILDSAQLFRQPQATLGRVCSFLGLDVDVTIPDLKPKNVGGVREPLDEEVRGWLESWFRPANQRLYDLLGEDFGW